MKNPQMMQDRITQMKNSPQTMSQMNEMMLNNPWNLQGMMNKIQGPMVSSMMSDPELRQQMIDTMMQNQQFMNNLRQNQEFMQQLNP